MNANPNHPRSLHRSSRKRQIDFEIIGGWIEPGSRVLDLGCGRGLLLEYLRQTKQVYALGVDVDTGKVTSCLKRGLNVWQGDADNALRIFPDRAFDTVVISRTIEMLPYPGATLREALRVGRRVAIGFINHGFWKNRLHYLLRGTRIHNDVYPGRWHESLPDNPLSLSGFEHFCREHGARIRNRVVLAGDWSTRVNRWTGVRGGYALYEVALDLPDPGNSTEGTTAGTGAVGI